MSKMTYTNGEFYIFRDDCPCKQTACVCNFKEFADEDIKLTNMGLADYKRLLENEDKESLRWEEQELR